MDWLAQGRKGSVHLQSGDGVDCDTQSFLDVVPRCPTTVCLESGLHQPFLEAEEANSALGLPVENCCQLSSLLPVFWDIHLSTGLLSAMGGTASMQRPPCHRWAELGRTAVCVVPALATSTAGSLQWSRVPAAPAGVPEQPARGTASLGAAETSPARRGASRSRLCLSAPHCRVERRCKSSPRTFGAGGNGQPPVSAAMPRQRPSPTARSKAEDAPAEDRSGCERGPSFGVVWVLPGWLFPFSLPGVRFTLIAIPLLAGDKTLDEPH